MGVSKYDIEIDLENRQGTSHAFLVEMVGANKRVLDVGCDTGYLGEALNALGNETVGFEANPATAEVARTKMSRVEIGDVETTNLVELFGPGSFEVIVFGDVLEHLRDPLPVLRQARPAACAGRQRLDLDAERRTRGRPAGAARRSVPLHQGGHTR